MEKTGSIDRDALIGLYTRFLAERDSLELKEATPESAEAARSSLMMHDAWEKVRATNIATFLFAEHIVLTEELNFARYPEQQKSLKNAIEEIQAARAMLTMIDASPDEYRAHVLSFGPSDIKDGLPMDACRKFFGSHSRRLGDRIKASVARPETEIENLRLRRGGLRQAASLYLAKQRGILGAEWRPPADYKRPELPAGAAGGL